MKAVLQRAARGGVAVGGREIGSVGRGLVVLLGVAQGDDENDARWMASKIRDLRVFEDGEGRMNLSVADVGGSVLVVSQFTLLADCRKGRRPSFVGAASPEEGERLYERVVELLREGGLAVSTGSFGERMVVSLENEGPVTIILDSARPATDGDQDG